MFLLQTLGRVGRVLKVYADGDLRVAVANQTWTFNPACCSIVPSIEPDNNNTNGGHEQRDHSSKSYSQISIKKYRSSVHTMFCTQVHGDRTDTPLVRLEVIKGWSNGQKRSLYVGVEEGLRGGPVLKHPHSSTSLNYWWLCYTCT